MRRAAALLSVMGFAVACGGGYEGEKVKTPDEIVAEQEAIAAEDEKREDATDTGVVGDEEEKAKTATLEGRDKGKLGAFPLAEVVSRLREETEKRA